MLEVDLILIFIALFCASTATSAGRAARSLRRIEQHLIPAHRLSRANCLSGWGGGIRLRSLPCWPSSEH
jgi:hypothetical protein